MRKTAIALLALGLTSAVIVAPASATTLMAETFSYSNGNLAVAPAVSGGNWTSHSGTVGTDILVTSSTAVGDMIQAYDDNRTFTAQTATAKTYACFKLIIPDPGAGTLTTNYFAHFKDTGTSNFMARVWVTPSGASYTLGLSAGSSATPTATWASALTYGTAYYVVIDYDATAGSADLWINAATEADTKITATGGLTGILISAFALRQSSTQTPAGSIRFKYIVDDLGVGTNMIDACLSGPTPTEGTTWGRLKSIYR